MPIPRETKFQGYEFTQAELYAATRLPALTAMLIQELYSQAAAQRLALKVDTENPQSFIQQEACLKGTMEAFEHLLLLQEVIVPPEAGSEKEPATTAVQKSPI